uniref:Uncharacterized protein n=1 Tax=Anopheles maculatus TaxID=74869 RepID=A0A182SGJ3_9DIPT
MGSPAVPSTGHGNNNGGSGGIQMPRLGSPAGSSGLAKEHELQHHGGGGLGGGGGGSAGGSMSRATPPGARDRALTARSNLSVNESGRSSSTGGNVHRSSPSSTASSMNHHHQSHLSHHHHHQQQHHQSHHGHAHHLPHHNPLSHLVSSGGSGGLSITKLGSPGSAHDLRISNSPDESPLASPIGMVLEPAVNLALGAGSQPPEDVRMHVPPPYGSKPPSRGGATGYTSNSSPPRPEHLFQDQDLAALVATSRACPPARVPDYKDSPVRPPASIKVEPLTECRGD